MNVARVTGNDVTHPAKCRIVRGGVRIIAVTILILLGHSPNVYAKYKIPSHRAKVQRQDDSRLRDGDGKRTHSTDVLGVLYGGMCMHSVQSTGVEEYTETEERIAAPCRPLNREKSLDWEITFNPKVHHARFRAFRVVRMVDGYRKLRNAT